MPHAPRCDIHCRRVARSNPPRFIKLHLAKNVICERYACQLSNFFTLNVGAPTVQIKNLDVALQPIPSLNADQEITCDSDIDKRMDVEVESSDTLTRVAVLISGAGTYTKHVSAGERTIYY